jgi:hypothetical protein
MACILIATLLASAASLLEAAAAQPLAGSTVGWRDQAILTPW